jgi:hypothetical protein
MEHDGKGFCWDFLLTGPFFYGAHRGRPGTRWHAAGMFPISRAWKENRMKTQIELAREGLVTPQMVRVAQDENFA